jgi:hypothetical protein
MYRALNSPEGAPQAKQIADRFHLVQNLRATIQRQLSGLERPIRGCRATPNRPLGTDGIQLDGEVGDDEPRGLTHVSGRPFLLAAFAKVRAMYGAGETVVAITRKLRLTRRIVDKWVRLESLPERARMTPKSSTPGKFANYLRDRWADGERNVRSLLGQVRAQGYTGCYSRLCRAIEAESRDEADAAFDGRHLATRPSDGRSDLTGRRGGAMYQTARHAHTASG